MLRVRTTLMLLLATGACILLLHLFGRRPPLQAAPVGAAARLIPGGLADIDSLIVERDGQRLELRRTGKAWDVCQPFSAGADTVAVLTLLDALERARVRDRFTLDEMKRRELNLGDLGLAPAAVRIVARSPSRRVELQFGACLPSGREVYVCSDQASEAVLVTEREAFAAVPESLDRMRERTLWRETQSRVTAIELRRPGIPFVKLIRDGDDWQMAQPFTARANAAVVGRALDALRAARIERFVWPSGTQTPDGLPGGIRTRLAYYGLDGESGLQVQIWESGNPVGMRLRFGRPVEDAPGWVYMLTPGDASVVAVTNAVPAALQVSPAELRDKRLLPARADAMTRLTLQFREETVSLTRGADRGWQLTTPVQVRADAAAVERLAQALADLRAERILDADPAAAAVAEPLCSVDVAAEGSEWRFMVTPAPAETGCVHIAFTNMPAVFVVAVSNLPAAIVQAGGMRGLVDRTVLALPAATVRRLAIRRGGDSWTVQRAANGEGWEAPAGREPDLRAISAWLELLAACQAPSACANPGWRRRSMSRPTMPCASCCWWGRRPARTAVMRCCADTT